MSFVSRDPMRASSHDTTMQDESKSERAANSTSLDSQLTATTVTETTTILSTTERLARPSRLYNFWKGKTRSANKAPLQITVSELNYTQPATGRSLAPPHTFVSSMAIAGIRKRTLGLISDYYLLRGVFLKSEYNQTHPNVRAFSDAGALDAAFGRHLTKVDQDAQRLLKRVTNREGVKISGAFEVEEKFEVEGNRNVWMGDVSEQDLLLEANRGWRQAREKLANLRRTLERENKGANRFYAYEPTIKFQMIGNQENETYLARKSKEKDITNKVAVGTPQMNMKSMANTHQASKGKRRVEESEDEVSVASDEKGMTEQRLKKKPRLDSDVEALRPKLSKQSGSSRDGLGDNYDPQRHASREERASARRTSKSRVPNIGESSPSPVLSGKEVGKEIDTSTEPKATEPTKPKSNAQLAMEAQNEAMRAKIEALMKQRAEHGR